MVGAGVIGIVLHRQRDCIVKPACLSQGVRPKIVRLVAAGVCFPSGVGCSSPTSLGQPLKVAQDFESLHAKRERFCYFLRSALPGHLIAIVLGVAMATATFSQAQRLAHAWKHPRMV